VTSQKRIAIIAALKREIHGFICNFREHSVPGTKLPCYSSENISVVCSGIGGIAAARAADVVLETLKPDLLISVGFAGALDPRLPVGEVIIPRVVISAETGKEYEAIAGDAVLVSTDRVAGADKKRLLRERYSAQAVDMEAAAIAERAARSGIPFLAVKAISDEAAIDLPDMTPFIALDGRFDSLRFSVHLLLQPSRWRTTWLLAKHTRLAARRLDEKLKEYMSEGKLDRSQGSVHPSIQG
jgi:adenosylhomocysteine nucleosidase